MVSSLSVATGGPSAVKLVEVWPKGVVGGPVPRERYREKNERIGWAAEGNPCLASRANSRAQPLM